MQNNQTSPVARNSLIPEILAVNTQGMTFDEALLFSTNMTHVFGLRGRPKKVADKLKITPMFGLKLLLGIPASYLSTQDRQVAEAVYIETYGTVTDQIWCPPHWAHKNPEAQPVNKYPVLDIEYIKSFGLPLTCWEEEVFVSTGIINRSANDILTESEWFRSKIMLRLFGFPETGSFFTEK